MSLAAVACGSGDVPPHAGGSAGGDPGCSGAACACAQGFVADASGEGCVEIAPVDDCPPGTRAGIGDAACQPVGWTAPCMSGMEPDPTGWGCRAVAPDAACSGATFEHIGDAGCIPIGDCAAPFPPAGATIFVDDDYGPGDVDATHFTSIQAALDAAPSGATIAVAAGTYAEPLFANRPVELVGRCAAQVRVTSPGGANAGFQAVGISGIVVRGLALSGHLGGFAAQSSSLTIEDCLVENSRGAGVVVLGGGPVVVRRSRIVGTEQDAAGKHGQGVLAQLGGQVELVESAVVGSHVAGVWVESDGSTLRLERTVVRDSLPAQGGPDDGVFGSGASALAGGDLEIVGSLLSGNRRAAIAVDQGGHAHVEGSVLRGTLFESDGNHGSGIEVTLGSTAEVTTSAMLDNEGTGAAVADLASKLVVSSSVVRGPIPAGPGPVGVGAVAVAGGALELTDVALVGNRDAGILAQDAGSLVTATRTLVRDTVRVVGTVHGDGVGVSVSLGGRFEATDCALVHNRLVGLALRTDATGNPPSSAHVTRLLVRDTVPAPETGRFGDGVYATDGADLAMDDSALVHNQEIGLAVSGATARVSGTVVRDTVIGTGDLFGHGALAIGGSTLTLVRTTVRGQPGVGVFFAASAGGLDGVVVAEGAVGIQAQEGTSLAQVEALSPETSPLSVEVTRSSRFLDVATRIGSGALPLPDPLD